MTIQPTEVKLQCSLTFGTTPKRSASRSIRFAPAVANRTIEWAGMEAEDDRACGLAETGRTGRLENARTHKPDEVCISDSTYVTQSSSARADTCHTEDTFILLKITSQETAFNSPVTFPLRLSTS